MGTPEIVPPIYDAAIGPDETLTLDEAFESVFGVTWSELDRSVDHKALHEDFRRIEAAERAADLVSIEIFYNK